MKSLIVLACLFSISLVPSWAQGGGGRRVGGTGARPRIAPPDLNPTLGIFLTGKVVVDDGTALTESALIQSICRGQKRTETHTDSHGSFSFQFGTRNTLGNSEVEMDSESTPRTTPSGRGERRNLQDCELQASLSGYRSDIVQLAGRFSGYENADIGRIVLHRMADVDGFTVSATTAEAPPAARKDLEKALEQVKKDHPEEAQKLLEKAVALFPRFAVAWFELGRVQLGNQDPVGARKSFEQSIAADPKYIKPYHGLTLLNQREKRWPELVEVSDKLLALNPVNFPEIWLSNAIGRFFLNDLAAAEKSARRGLELDLEHRLPRLEYLMGAILMQKADYPAAAEHFRAFLRMTRLPADVAEGNRQLAELARLSGTDLSASGQK